MDVIDRFLKYVTFDTASDEESESCPSTAKQLVLADYLVQQLREIGIEDACRDEHGYVYAHIAASRGMENATKIGFIAHMDTSPDVSGTDVKPRIVRFDGKNLNMVDKKYIGQELVVSDGTTLLGADDKAGVAEIISACERIVNDGSLVHGQISVGFTPDEEIGRGADLFDIKKFDAEYAYTVDGGELGEIEDENFNAAAVYVKVNGVNTHPGSAKNKMKNAVLYLNRFVSLLPREQTPEKTEGREGFFHVHEMTGNETQATLKMLIRDHDRARFEEKKRFVADVAAQMNKEYGDGTFEIIVTDSYYNMKEIIDRRPEIVERAKAAMTKAGVRWTVLPIRGGTDGARLSFEGLPCPNLSTGGMNFHSIYEAVPVEAMKKMTEVIINIATE